MGMILGPANTDAINRAPKTSYGEATGITQTVRNYGSSLGLAVLGTILITENTNNVESALGKLGLPQGVASRIASDLGNSGGRPSGAGVDGGGDRAKAILHSVEQAYAQSTETIFLIMTGVLAAIFVFSLFFLPRGKLDQAVDAGKFDK
jgi:hypothetical protein